MYCHGTAEDERVSNFNCKSSAKKVSVQAQQSCKFYNEKLTTPRLRRALFVDEAMALSYRRPSGRPRPNYYTTETEVLVSVLPSRSFQKPWPSGKGAGMEELVKYMSSIPCYLQHSEKVDNVQEKALNFGVIGWTQLEKWTNNHKAVQKNEISPCADKLKNYSCPYSTRSSSNSLVQGKQTSSLDNHHLRSADEKSRFTSDPPDSRTSPVSKTLWSNHEKCCKSKNEHTTSTLTEVGNLTENVKSNQEEKQRSVHDGHLSDKGLERNFWEHGLVSNPLQGSSSIRNKALSAMHLDRKSMEVRKSLTMKHPQNCSHKDGVLHGIPLSDLSSATYQSDKLDIGVADLSTTNGFTSPKFMSKNEEASPIDNFTGNLMFNKDKKSGNLKVEDASVGKKYHLIKRPSVAGLKWLRRSSSLKDTLTSHQLKDINGLDVSDDKGRSNSRGKRSPLKRILNPLLKPKNDGNSELTARLPINQSREQRNSFSLSSDSSIGPYSSQMPFTSHSLLQDESYGAPMTQALLKLVWKNAQPLLMFSTNDNKVLVASMRGISRLGKDDPSEVYKIVTAQESRKKGGIWTGQSRNNKPNLLYDVVGHMKVSCPKMSSSDSKNLEMSRQFVLVDDKLLQCKEPLNSDHRNELAAVIVKAPYRKMKGSIYDTHVESLQMEMYPEYSRMSSIAAIIPSGIHSFSDSGNPSTILERWKSGGSCDCGGWDEGCRLTVLSDRPSEMKVAIHGIHHTELFFQGKKGENKYAFSMIAFKEGLYTIEFGPLISTLQAFAICIATLHDNSIQRDGGLTGYEPHHPPFSPVGRF